MSIVADTGPLIGLARIDSLSILRELYGSVLIPSVVKEELELDTRRPGASALREAFEEAWLTVAEIENRERISRLSLLLDPGEAEAIVLAQDRELRLLIDERRGRELARRRGVTVIGTGAVLISAKESALITRIAPVIDRLGASGYRLSDRLREELLVLAGEG